MIILGFMFLIIGIMVISASYVIYAIAINDVIQTELYESSIAVLVGVPGILLVAFLVLIITSIIKLQKGNKWQSIYIIAMIFYFVILAIYYTSIPDPLKDLILFTNFSFIASTIGLFLGNAKMKKKLTKQDEKDTN